MLKDLSSQSSLLMAAVVDEGVAMVVEEGGMFSCLMPSKHKLLSLSFFTSLRFEGGGWCGEG